MGMFSNCYSPVQVRVKCGFIYWILERCRRTVTWIGRICDFTKNIEGTECKIINTKYRNCRGGIEGIDYNVWIDIWFIKLGAMLFLSFIISYSDFFLRTFALYNTQTHSRLVGIPWIKDQPVTETYIWQQTTLRTDIPAPVGFEPAIPASESPQTHSLDRAANGIGGIFKILLNTGSRLRFENVLALPIMATNWELCIQQTQPSAKFESANEYLKC
jgi:hypothetical protein